MDALYRLVWNILDSPDDGDRGNGKMLIFGNKVCLSG